VLFLERDVPWNAANRDLQALPPARIELYSCLRELKERFGQEVRQADFVMVGSYTPDGVAVGEWVTTTTRGATAFYDIDTPVTLARLEQGRCDYLSLALIRRYALYLSFTGGPILRRLERRYGASRARALYCAVDPSHYYPERCEERWDLGYLGTYSLDRQPRLEAFLIEPARCWEWGRFAVAGPQYPGDIDWPVNVRRVTHLPPDQHRAFYNAQRFTLNVTRTDMIRAGFSPSIRLFEAAACATPIISDDWQGLETFLTPGKEILVARTSREVLNYLRTLPDAARTAVGQAARARVLAEHTAAHRAAALESYVRDLRA
jgi:spore maturation protein CgeB